ncbi:MAG: hypothetical protein ABL994_20810 [Verrucomicrobiales bacterium]
MGEHEYYRVVTCRLVAVWALFGLIQSTVTLKAEDASFFSVAMSYIDRTMKSLSVKFSPAENATSAPAVDSESLAKRAALDILMKKMFLREKGYHFTQSRWGATPIPYQIEEMQAVELDSISLNGADRASGIDQRVTFEIRVKQYRQFDQKSGWGEWIKGNPPHLDSFTLVHQSGAWKVSVSPAWAYSLR